MSIRKYIKQNFDPEELDYLLQVCLIRVGAQLYRTYSWNRVSQGSHISTIIDVKTIDTRGYYLCIICCGIKGENILSSFKNPLTL